MPVRDLLSAASGASAPNDPNFANVTLLLDGNGTNGAQNNTFVDSSTNNFTITRNGNTTQGSFSPYGTLWSNYFDGSGDYLTTPSSSNVANVGTGDFTLETWFYPITNTTYYYLIVDTSGSGLYIGYDNVGTLVVAGRRLTASDNTVSYTPTLNQWNHLVVVRESGSISAFVNGSRIYNGSNNINYSGNGTTYYYGSIGASYNGYISNQRFVKSAVYSASATTITVPTSPLTAVTNTTLLMAQSNRFIDNSSSALTISVNGNPSIQRFSPFEPTAPYSTSVIGGSGYFDGSGDYLATPTSSQFTASGDFTVSCWFLLQSFANAYYVVGGNWVSGGTDEWLIQVANDGSIRFLTNEDGTFSSTGVVRLNEWTFFRATRSGTTVTVNVNGTTVRTYTKSNTLGSATKTINIGRQPDGSWAWNGYITDFRLVSGSAITDTPTAPLTAVSGTNLLCNFTNAGIPDLAMQNNLETVGNAQVSTSVKKFGTGSMSFNGTNSALTAPQNNVLGFGTGNFTVEFWMYPNSTPAGARTLIDFRSPTNNNDTKLSIWITSGNKFIVYSATTAKLNDVGSWSATQWAHIALCKSGSTTNLYVNGTSVGSFSDTTNYGATSFVTVASDNGQSGYWFNGYIDDLRITNGLARYTANFTAPIAPFPTF